MSDAVESEGAPPSRDLNLSRYLWVVLKHVWLVLIVFVLAAGAEM